MARTLNLAIIGAGATTLYLLKHLLDHANAVRDRVGVRRIVVFEAGGRPGPGMPYSPKTTDRHNICNISSEELPRLQQTFADWLRGLDDDRLAEFDLQREEIDPAETYARIALGGYFEAQFRQIADALRRAGVAVEVRVDTKVQDVRDEPEHDRVCLQTADADEPFDRVVIATGHTFSDDDDPANGYFASPWPIHKLLPRDGEHFDFEIGTLGASLSAFDVVASLAHRHGTFHGEGESLRFEPNPAARQFRIVMYSAEGWLPHLQYEQAEPMRKVYRHVSREQILDLRDDNGFLRLETYWDAVCRPALAKALREDDCPELARRLADGSMSLEGFVDELGQEHTYDDAFAGMRRELPEARRSLDQDRPIRWKEVLDDLVYALNFHAELLPAEDHARLRSTLMPFLFNVIAAMPLRSARMLLALHAAKRLELIQGTVTIQSKEEGKTTIEVENDGETSTRTYRMFIDCSGQGSVTTDDYPFRSLVNGGVVRPAKARFADEANAADLFEKLAGRRDEAEDGSAVLRLDGIAIDAGYRVLDKDGKANRRVIDIAFPHALGLRPYSYGLQACDHTAGMVVETWLREAEAGEIASDDERTFTELQAAEEAGERA